MSPAEYSLAAAEQDIRNAQAYFSHLAAKPRTPHVQAALNHAATRLGELRARRARILERRGQ